MANQVITSRTEEQYNILLHVRHPTLENLRVQTVIEGQSMTHQSHKDTVDINRIIDRFDRTGELPQSTRQPQYADVTALQAGDLTERINFSRDTLDAAGRELNEIQEAEKQKLKQKQADLEDEIKRLKAAQQPEE